MASKVLVLHNDDGRLAHGGEMDRLAVSGVLEAVAGIERAASELGDLAQRAAAPEDLGELAGLVRREAPDVVVNLVESLAGEARLEAAVAWQLEMLGVPYTGSGPAALTIALDKAVTQRLLLGAGVPVPRHVVLGTGDESLDGLAFPAIVKPIREDASHGIEQESVVADAGAARARARHLIEAYRQPALVEEFVSGREFNVSILGDGDAAAVLPLREIDFSAYPPGRPPLVSYAAKWVEGSEEYRGTTARAALDVEPALASRIVDAALAAYRTVGLRDYGRIDLRLDASGNPRVLDVNANPDLSPSAGFAAAAALAGLDYRALVRRLLDSALSRGRREDPALRARRERVASDRLPGVVVRGLRPDDRAPLARILDATAAFTADEIAVALELIDEGLAPNGDPDYRFVVAETEGRVAGYACYGPTPLTDGVYDLYWIAVDPALHGRGVGVALLRAAEDDVRRRGGRQILIETASKPSYAKTRAFYERAGYSIWARLPDFYRSGDDKLVYGLRV